MRAVRVRDHEPVLETEVAEPVAGEGEAVVAVEAACIAHFDLQIARGNFPVRPPAPYIGGTDGAGRVVSAEGFEPGARVWFHGAGMGVVRDGTWGERVTVPVEALHALPEGTDAALAATFFIPFATARAALHEIGGLQQGERVCVRGAAGAVGQVAVQMALAYGAGEVIAIIGSESRAAAIPSGARVVVAPGSSELASLAGADIDLAVDMVGGSEFNALLPAMRAGGRIALVGYVGGNTVPLDTTALLERGVSILAANVMHREPQVIGFAPDWLDGLAKGDLTLSTMVFPVELLSDAITAVETSPSVGRVALLF